MLNVNEKIESSVKMYDDIIRQSIGKEVSCLSDIDDVQLVTGRIILLIDSLLKILHFDNNCSHEPEDYYSWPLFLSKCKKCGAIQKKTMHLTGSISNVTDIQFIDRNNLKVSGSIKHDISAIIYENTALIGDIKNVQNLWPANNETEFEIYKNGKLNL